MKAFKKLVPALCLLLVSAVLMGTSTYAWLAMNTKVDATGMQVNLKSENTFLLISADKTTATDIRGQKKTTVGLAVGDDESKVFPAKPMGADDIGEGKLLSTGTPVTTKATAADAKNWFTAISNDPAASTPTNGVTATALTTENFSKYVIKRTVYLAVAAGSDDAYKLTVKATKFTAKTGTATDISAVKVLVVTDFDNMATLTSTTTEAVSLHETNNLVLTSTAGADKVEQIAVDIYIYYDGSASVVYTNNITSLAGADIELQFSVEVETATA